ncbi:MAG TPA: DUF6688 family protein [Anaerolineales bacterium]|nr:DUF6688 family protein [Anaerolineales bacterium]
MMELEASSDQTVVPEPSIFLPFPKARWGRVLYGLFVTVLPAFSFWATDLLKPEWQNGELRSYVILLLFPEASLLFFPLLAYSIVCYLLLLVRPSHFARSWIVRFGTYTGVLLALQYSVLMIFLLDGPVYIIILIWIFPTVFFVFYRRAVARWAARSVNRVLFILVPVILLIAALLTKGDVPLVLLMILMIGAPFWSLLISLRAAVWLFKNYETRFTFPRVFGLTAWLAAYAVAWRFDILKMYELYAALPKEPPNCYIATAAACGHPYVVGSWTIQRVDGKSMQVNRQLQRLKCAELALMAIQPRLHGLLRRIYDVIGRRLARSIQNPLLADAAYLLLKPWEWGAGLIIKTIVPEIDSISRKMYLD